MPNAILKIALLFFLRIMWFNITSVNRDIIRSYKCNAQILMK
jgi:hypothetical protein